MSGGHWNYEDTGIGRFGETLVEDDDPAVAALGKLLIRVGQVLHDIDWFRSGDTSRWDRERLLALLPPDAVIEIATERAEKALADLSHAINGVRR